MDVFSTTAKKYAAPLIAKKYTQAAIDAIATKRTTLITTKTAQEVAKNSRLGVTQNRVILLNNVWASRTKLAKAAKVIFAANYAKYKLYLLPASEEAGTTFSVIGTITDKTTTQPLAGVQVSNGADSTTTNSYGKYGFAKLANGCYTLMFTFTNYKTATQTFTFVGTALVVNASMEK
jgi:hypothetical protein